MLHKVLPFLLMFFAYTGFGQEANTSISVKKTIKTSFSMQSVKAYQESAVFKIKDYYNYLEIYSNSKTSDSLKLQSKAAIHNLFENKNIEVIDVTTFEKYCIQIDKLLEKVADKNFKFKMTHIEHSIAGQDFWTTKYYLQVIEGEEICNLEVFSKVIFKPVQKVFGSKTKEVWTLFLGEME
jgi:hypothetical protein